METELLTLYNVMSSYKCALMTVLDKIDHSIMQALNVHRNTRTKQSISKKYKLSLEIVDVVRNYVQMLYTGENIAEELLSKLSELERDTEPERERRTSNPFLTESSNEQCGFNLPLFKNELEEINESIFNTSEPDPETIVESLTDVKNEENSETEDSRSIDVSRESTPTPNVKEEEKVETQNEITPVEEVAVSNLTPIKMEAVVTNLNSDPDRVHQAGELPPQNCRNRVTFKIEPKKHPRLIVPKEKIIKKTDSHSKFENKKKLAHNEKKSKEKSVTYDILDDDLHVSEECFFCHIVTPSEFYLRSDQALFERLDNDLNEELNKQKSKYVVNKYKTKEEARTNLGNICFGFIQQKRKWFRIEVLDWMMEDVDRIFVQLIDYGEKLYSSYNTLRPMNATFSVVPKMAIRCHLAGVDTPDPQGRWSRDSIDCFVKLSEMHRKTIFKPIYVHKEDDSYAVDLLKVKSSDGTPIGALLVRSGYALQFNISEDNLTTLDVDDLEEFDNITEAISGYDAKDEARICPFTDETGSKCFKGASCKLEHGRLSVDGITTDKMLAPSEPLAELILPRNNSYINIYITGYIDSCHFYAHIITNRADGSRFNKEFYNLRTTMRANNVVETYEPFKVFPGIAELVLVREGPEWLRGKCRGYSESSVIEVFLVDFGSTVFKKLKDLRQMKEDFLYVPFQAVECILSDCQENADVPRENSLDFFQKCMNLHEFKALVKDNSIPLKLQLWDGDGNDMTYVIKLYGLGEDRIEDFFPVKKPVLVCD